MVGYKKKYFEVKNELDKIRNNCIDLRDFELGLKPIVFNKQSWELDNSNEDWILIYKRKIRKVGL